MLFTLCNGGSGTEKSTEDFARSANYLCCNGKLQLPITIISFSGRWFNAECLESEKGRPLYSHQVTDILWSSTRWEEIRASAITDRYVIIRNYENSRSVGENGVVNVEQHKDTIYSGP